MSEQNMSGEPAAEQEEPREKCPWCGKEMERGYLAGPTEILWTPGRAPDRITWREYIWERTDAQLKVDNEGTVSNFKTTWYCRACRKMVFDAAGLQPPPDPWEGGEIVPYVPEKQETDPGWAKWEELEDGEITW